MPDWPSPKISQCGSAAASSPIGASSFSLTPSSSRPLARVCSSARVWRLIGSPAYPETRAYGSDGLPEQVLYQVAFDQGELWPGSKRHPRDITCVDIFEHWLEAE